MCSVADCALGSCTSNSVMRQDYPLTRAFSYDSPTIFHHSTVTPSANSAYGSTAGGWIMTIIGRNFGFYADVVNVSVASSIYDNPRLSLATGRYWDGKASCRIPCTPGAEADGVGQYSGVRAPGSPRRSDEYQCDSDFVSGGGNKWMSDTHILCIMPAGVGIAKGLTVAIGSAQVDGPSPVPALHSTSRFGQAHGFGYSPTTEGYAAEVSTLQVASARELFGWGYCQRDHVTDQREAGATGIAEINAGYANQLLTKLGKHCQSIADCLPPPPKPEFDVFGEPLPLPPVPPDLDESGNPLPPWRCIAWGTLARTQDIQAPVVFGGIEVSIAVADYGLVRGASQSGDEVTLAGWSVATGGLAGDHLSRPPGINVGPSDGDLDQMAHSINAFSYARPVVHLVVPREGPVRRTRRITVDGANFGIQSRYIEVFVAGIAQRTHALGQTLVNKGGGEGGGLFAFESALPVGGSDEICCSCDWYCAGSPRVCRCRSSTAASRTRCIAGSNTPQGCLSYQVEV